MGEKDTAEASNSKEQRNPVKNLRPEFLSAILESDDQLDYHTDALLGYYDTDGDKRLMIVDLKDSSPPFMSSSDATSQRRSNCLTSLLQMTWIAMVHFIAMNSKVSCEPRSSKG